MTIFNIAILPGDGIGGEVMAEGIKVLDAVTAFLLGVQFKLAEYSVGAAEYLRNGNPLPIESFAACEHVVT
jgi:isocitrate/isopropylmalate dehydrogenase